MRRQSKKFYFSVEGETEQWYLEWLRDTINASPNAKFNLSLDCQIQKDPVKRAKRLNVLTKTNITHIFDRESEDAVHTDQFTTTLSRMKEAEKTGRDIKYHLGYSNFSFELWMILHKVDCNGAKTHRSHYLDPINRAFSEEFEDLDKYKKENNFKRVLAKLSLNDVREAIGRSKAIMKRNREIGYKLINERTYKYYKENPSLSIWESVEKILDECGLLK